jgi:hypothetical protein
MRRLAITCCAVFATTSLHAEINTRTLTVAGISDCLVEAVSANAVDDDGSAITFSCSAARARTLYNFLGKKIPAELVHDRNGKFENRPFGSGACYHRIEDERGRAADDFRCDLILSVGNPEVE